MNIFQMTGSWGTLESALYEEVVAAGIGPLYIRLLNEIDPKIPLRAEVLDVGCGSGPVACILARRRPDLQVLGVDLASAMIQRAKQRQESENLQNICFQEQNAMALELADDRFGTAYSVASIKHWPEPARGIAEMARVVRSGGLVGILEADRETTAQRARNFCRLWRWQLPGGWLLSAAYFKHFVAGQAVTKAELQNWFAQAGLVEIETQSDPDQPFVVATGKVP